MATRISLSGEDEKNALHAIRHWKLRNRCLIEFGLRIGFRASEIGSLTVGQIWDGARVRDEVTVSRCRLKGGRRLPPPRGFVQPYDKTNLAKPRWLIVTFGKNMKKLIQLVLSLVGGLAAAYLIIMLWLPKIALNRGAALVLLSAMVVCGAVAKVMASRRKNPLPWPLRIAISLSLQSGIVAALLLGHQVVKPEIYERIRRIDREVRGKAGSIAPELSFIEVGSGKADTLSALRGRVVLVNFWATWCSPCVKEMPDLSTIQERYRSKGFVLLTLSVEETSKIQRFFAKTRIEGMHGKLESQASIPDFYGYGKVYPTSYLIDREGRVSAAFPSTVPIDTLVHHLKQLL